ncbi:Crp/Fnr family transcriptional regulator [Chloroflexota bacterium]
MQYSGKAQILKQSPIFSSLNDDELAELANLSIERSFRTNEFIFWDGDAPEWFYIIAEGKVKVLKHSSSGREFVIAFFNSGEMFGEVAVFEGESYPASAQAIAETKVVGIRREDFLSFLAHHPALAHRIINILGGATQGCPESP